MYEGMMRRESIWMRGTRKICGTGEGYQHILMVQLPGKMGRQKEKFNLLFVLFSGITYFFKNGHFWRFDDYMVITDTEIPLKIAPHWFDCR